MKGPNLSCAARFTSFIFTHTKIKAVTLLVSHMQPKTFACVRLLEIPDAMKQMGVGGFGGLGRGLCVLMHPHCP